MAAAHGRGIPVSYTHLDVYKRQESALQSPENPVREVKDGSIDFDNVSFKYAKTAERMALDVYKRQGPAQTQNGKNRRLGRRTPYPARKKQERG